MASDCGLCEAASEIQNPDRGFFHLVCRTCGNPMIVLAEHRGRLTADEQRVVDEIIGRMYPGRRRRGYMRDIPAHWHEHLIE